MFLLRHNIMNTNTGGGGVGTEGSETGLWGRHGDTVLKQK